MAKTAAKRDVGREILEGLRQLKRGEVGRVVRVPATPAPKRMAKNEPKTLSATTFPSSLSWGMRYSPSIDDPNSTPAAMEHGKDSRSTGDFRRWRDRAPNQPIRP